LFCLFDLSLLIDNLVLTSTLTNGDGADEDHHFRDWGQ
jgi:hypothetical protein